MARARKPAGELDTELEDLPAPARWREWMGRVEAVIFASAQPVLREDLARVVGRGCNLDLVIEDIRDELRGRPYEIVSVAGGWSFRTKLGFGEAIRAAGGHAAQTELSRSNALVLMAIAYFQPITRGDLSQFFGREVSRDTIASLRGEGFIAAGPRSPTPGAPYAYVTTPVFLAQFGFESLRDLPDMEKLEDAGLLGTANRDRPGRAGPALGSGTGEAPPDRTSLLADLAGVLGLMAEEDEPEEDAA
jgi:segregation and condensation protein B